LTISASIGSAGAAAGVSGAAASDVSGSMSRRSTDTSCFSDTASACACCSPTDEPGGQVDDCHLVIVVCLFVIVVMRHTVFCDQAGAFDAPIIFAVDGIGNALE
jgi:hypothetical protein